MQTKDAHIIQKLVVEVNTSTTKQGYDIKDNARSFIDRFVIPAVESYVAELELLIDDHQVVQIDQLTIEIEAKNTELASPELTFIIQQAFEKSLSESTVEIAQFNSISQQQKQKNEHTELQISTSKHIENDVLFEKDSFELMTSTSHQVKALFYFLEFGTRPWWSKDAAQFNDLLQEEKVLAYIEKELPMFTRMFVNKLANKRTKQRLILQFSDSVLAELVLLIAHPLEKTKQKEIDRFYDLIKDVTWFNGFSRLTRQLFWEFVIEYVLQSSSGKTISDEECATQLLKITHNESIVNIEKKEQRPLFQHQIAIVRWLHQLTNSTKSASYYDSLSTTFVELSTLTITAKSKNNSKLSDEDSEVMDDFKQQIAEPERPEQDQLIEKQDQLIEDKEQLAIVELKEASPEISHEKLVDEKEQSLEQLVVLEKQENREITTDEDVIPMDISNGIFVDNAGLILIHPFLKHFFKQVGLLSEDEKSLTDPFLAVHLLHFIATGEEQDFEHTLLFEKYLVGLPFEEIVPRDIQISDQLKSEVASLLGAVKENWEPLRETSNQGLQETFLVRSGKLMNLNEHPRLVIERKTVDILLEKIEWSMSLVHFTWMDKLLYVEW